ncbi:MAG: hypothetical protein U0939_22430 [Pirellulales bacterium]
MNAIRFIDEKIADANIYIAAIMVVAIAWGTLAFAIKSKTIELSDVFPGVPAGVVFWMGWWLELLVVYSLITDPVANYWLLLLFDGFANVALIATAWSLMPKDKVPTLWHFSAYLAAGTLTLVSWNLIFGKHLPFDSPAWRMFVAAPGMILATCGFLFLAYSASKQFPPFATYIWALCLAYGLCQPPAYYCHLIDPSGNLVAKGVISALLALGKLLFVLLFVSILVTNTTNFGTDRGVRIVKTFLTVASMASTIALIVVKLATFM